MKYLGPILVLLYVVGRYGFYEYWNTLHIGFSYLLEIVFCVLIAFINKENIKNFLSLNSKRIDRNSIIFMGLCGGACAYIAKLNFGIPFPLSETFTFIALLVIAPLLEESIFHMALWLGLMKIRSPKYLLILTSLAFSTSHLIAILYVPEVYKGFVLFQSFYTLVLGIFCGLSIYKYQNLISAVLVHFSFNLGFTVIAIL